MAVKKGTIRFIGDRGRDPEPTGKTTISNPTDLTTLTTLATWIATNLSDCNIKKVSISESGPTDDTRPGSIPPTSVDEIAVMIVEDTARGSIVKHSIPGVKPTVVLADSAGDRVDFAVVQDWAAQLTIATGITYKALYGYVIKKK